MKRQQHYLIVDRKDAIQQLLLKFSLFNLLLVAVTGLYIRGIPVFGSALLPYKNMLHGHSHFAFGGWITPVLSWIIMNTFPGLRQNIQYRDWRNIVLLLLVSAYGMLVSFPFEGYGPVSIIFSTISVAGTFYLATVIWKALKHDKTVSALFLRSAVFFMVISAIGPFATGPIMASGNAGSPLYYNAVYFYLHFQYNGWFTFAILAILHKQSEGENEEPGEKKPFYLLLFGCVLSLPLSFLWNDPGILYNFIGGTGSVLQLAGAVYLIKYRFHKTGVDLFARRMLMVVMFAFALKFILQTVSALPYAAKLAFNNRPIVIAYLHLVMLGYVTLFALIQAYASVQYRNIVKVPIMVFLLTFIVTEMLLVVIPFAGVTPSQLQSLHVLLFWCSVGFPFSALFIFTSHLLYRERSLNRLRFS